MAIHLQPVPSFYTDLITWYNSYLASFSYSPGLVEKMAAKDQDIPDTFFKKGKNFTIIGFQKNLTELSHVMSAILRHTSVS